MKTFTLSVLLAMSMASAAQADPFQLVDQATGAHASGAAVYLKDKLLGYTDNYGRIVISMSPGPYTVSVSFMGKTRSVSLTVTGSQQLQVVTF
jgi:hypothetical protein